MSLALDDEQIATTTRLLGDLNREITNILLVRDDMNSLLRTHEDAVADASTDRLDAARTKALTAAQAMVTLLR